MAGRTDSRTVLLLTCEDDLSADLVLLALRELGARVLRLNIEHFPSRIMATITLPEARVVLRLPDGEQIDDREIAAVWFRRWPATVVNHVDESWRPVVQQETVTFLRGWTQLTSARWMNHPDRVAVAENKVAQLVAARHAGLLPPPTLVTNDPERIRRFLSTPTVAKPLFCSTVRVGDTALAIGAKRAPLDTLCDPEASACPVIYQRLIEGREWRITVIADQVFAARLVWKPDAVTVDVHASENVKVVPDSVSGGVSDSCVRLTKALGLSYAAIDMIERHDGQFFFLELNPSGQWGWIETETKYPITKAIAKTLAEEW